MGDLQSALSTAFDEAVASPEPASTTSGGETAEPEARETTSEPAREPEKATEPAVAAEDETGDVLFDRLTPEQIGKLKATPEGRALYKGLMQSYTQKMQKFSEQEKLWNALNNPETQRAAVEALARSVGLPIQPNDLPQRQQAAAVADQMMEDPVAKMWSDAVGPEAAAILRAAVEKTALAAVQGTLQPLQQASEYLQMDARSRQAEAQVGSFRANCQKNGWEITPQIESKMAELGQQILPARPIESVDDGVRHLERLYRLATADGQEAAIEKRVLERMNKAAQSAEPARGVPSTGREKRSNITKDMNLTEAMDAAFEELGLTGR